MDYTQYITSEHQKPKFLAWASVFSDAFNDAQQALQTIKEGFSVDSAVGVQLDAVGYWVGLSRSQQVPISGVFFTWDDPALGWNYARWKGPYEPSQGVVSLDDDSYRAALKGKIACNYFKGTLQSANEILENAFSLFNLYVFIIDRQDMSVDVYVAGQATAVFVELVRRGVVIPKTAGVRINSISVAPGPFFALDAETSPFLAGLDVGVFT